MQVHDFNGTINPSGLFWIVQVPDSALTVTGRTVRVQVDNVAVVDNFTFLGPNEVPATASFDITWTSFGKVQHYRPQSTDPTDPTNFAGEFRLATATGSFSASEGGFAFTSTPGATSAGIFAETGTERNGSFLPE